MFDFHISEKHLESFSSRSLLNFNTNLFLFNIWDWSETVHEVHEPRVQSEEDPVQ